MDVRTKFKLAFLGICFVPAPLLLVWIILFPHMPVLRWVPLIIVGAVFVAVYWLFRHYRGRLPRPTQEQRLKGSRAARRMAWIYFGGLVLGLISGGWQKIVSVPHGAGFLILLIPILLGTYYLRLSIKLSRADAYAHTPDQIVK